MYSYSGKCVFVSRSHHTFLGCESEVCGPAGASLACVQDATQNHAISELSDWDTVWIGLHGGLSGEWAWNSGCTSNFTNWLAGELNNLDGRHGCAVNTGDAGWSDEPCNNAARCVCEYNAEPTTEYTDWARAAMNVTDCSEV